MKAVLLNCLFWLCICYSLYGLPGKSQTIATHFNTDLSSVSNESIEAAKAQYRVWYGHTSHGSQITSGMSVLQADYPELYNYNTSGSGGALAYQEVSGDLGHNGDLAWEVATRTQLNRLDNDRNLVIWSWCGGASDNTISGINTYLSAMNQLESDFPEVTFIYMTGHLDGTGEAGNLHQCNNQIRQYCQDNAKILFDFADIESYDPDDNYFLDLGANDNCDYWIDSVQHNWAQEWCASNPGVCSNVSCAHSQSLNCDRKGAAFWWLLAELADPGTCVDPPYGLEAQLDAVQRTVDLSWNSSAEVDSFQLQRRMNSGSWVEDYATIDGHLFTYQDTALADGLYAYRVLGHLNDGGNGQPCDSNPSSSVTVNLATQPPVAPTGLQATYSAQGVLLTWVDESSNEQGFRIQKSVNSQGFAQVGSAPVNAIEWLDDQVIPLTDLEYRVFSWNDFGDSGFSNTVSISIPEESYVIRLEDVDEVDDAFLDPNNPDTSYGLTPYVSEMFHFILKFQFPEALQNKTILSAHLAFYGWAQVNWQPDQYLDLFRVTEYWEETSVTWNQACDCGSWSLPGGDFDRLVTLGQVPITENCDHCFYPEVDVTATVQSWMDGCLDNDGFMLVNDSLTHTSLKASEYSASQRTYLEITYTNEPHVVEDLFQQICLAWCSPELYQSGYDMDGNQIINILDLLLSENGCSGQ